MASTKYRAEDDRVTDEDEAIVNVIDGDDTEDGVNIDINTEIFDVEDEDEEDEDGERKSIQAACEKERKRAQALTNLEKQARHLGVSFDAVEAIRSGMSLEKARHAVLTTAASKSASLKVSPYAPHRDGNSKAKINAKWEAAWRAVQ